MKTKFAWIVLTLLILPTSLFAYKDDSREKSGGVSQTKNNQKKITSEAGLNIPQWGIAIDAVYDNRLDSLIPGYKILNVVLSNKGASNIYLDPKKDHWYIVDNIGKTIHGITHLRLINEHLWLSLPTGLREKLEYPQTLRVGNSAKIDLFFPNNVSLENFREIGWESSHFKKEFNVITANEKNLDDKNEPLPDTPTYKQSAEKYDQIDPLILKNAAPQVDTDIKSDAPKENHPPEFRDIPAL